ncbi:MAG: hypothetical protein ACPGSW_06865 [Phaeobacter italicus]
MQTAHGLGVIDHPQAVMRHLGIQYQTATPQSLGDQWWFWNCAGEPDPLPGFLSELDLDPMECVGFGLSEEGARQIAG